MRWVIFLALPLMVAAQTTRICAGCHPKIARTYALTGMARSFYRPQPLTTGSPFYHQLSNTWYSMVSRDGTLYQRRWRIGPDGKEINVQESSVDHVMGSGNHVRTAQTKGARPADVRAAIVNPARLSPARQMEVCMQCHLETTSLQLA